MKFTQTQRIVDKTQDQFDTSRDEILELIRVFEQFLELPNPKSDKVYEDNIANEEYGMALDMALSNVEMDFDENAYNAIEAVLKKLIRLLYPNEWKGKWDKFETGLLSKEPWQCASLLDKEGVRTRAENYARRVHNIPKLNLNYKEDDSDKYKDYPDFLKQYIECYQSRNNYAHGIDYSKKGFLFVVYLDLMQRYKQQIRDAHNSYVLQKSLDINGFCQKVVEQYTKSVDQYEMLSWKETRYGKIITANCLEENIAKIPKKVMKLAGDPGIGKSEALLYCQYIACKNYLENTADQDGMVQTLPIIVRLRDLRFENAEKAITNVLCRKLNVDENTLDKIMKSGMISLYLDGFNEILDDKIRSRVAMEINDHIIGNYAKKMMIIVTDRHAKSNPIVADGALCYELVPPTEKQLVSLYRKKLKAKIDEDPFADEETKIQTLESLTKLVCENDEELTEAVKWIKDRADLRSPYGVTCTVDYIVDKKKVPNKTYFWWNYLKGLMERESRQNGDTMVGEQMYRYLTQLALDMDQSQGNGMTLAEVNECMKKNGADSDKIEHYLYLWERLHIFYGDDGNIFNFANEMYKDYFYTSIWRKENFNY